MASGSILLVDDNVVQAATRKTILANNGYDVVAVLDPRRALDQLQTNALPQPIWLIITDHIMPVMSGSAFVREVRKLLPSLPVIVISGLEEAEEEYRDLNVTFRMKPLNPETLLGTVAALAPAARNLTSNA